MNENTCALVLLDRQVPMELLVIPAKLAKEDFLDQLVRLEEVARMVIREWMAILAFPDFMGRVE